MDNKLVGQIVNPQATATSRNSQSSHQASASEKVQDNVETSSIREHLKLTKNKMILESALESNISAGNKSMELLYRTAIENINAELEPIMGENAIQGAYESGLDVSPEATAERIVSMSTSFFGSYYKQHSEMPLGEALESFVSIIGGGIDTGFSEAKEILDGLSVLEGDIAENIDKTYVLVQEGLKAFIDNFPKPETGPATML